MTATFRHANKTWNLNPNKFSHERLEEIMMEQYEVESTDAL